MTLEEQLQDAYEHAAELAPVSPGAYDRFLRRRVRHGRVVAATAGLALVAVLGAAVLIARQLPQDRAPATNAAEPTPRPHQWVYSKELRGGVRGPQARHHRALGPGRRQAVRPPNQRPPHERRPQSAEGADGLPLVPEGGVSTVP
jgi:hypothetical protein